MPRLSKLEAMSSGILMWCTARIWQKWCENLDIICYRRQEDTLFRSKMWVSSSMSEYISPHKKRVTFSSLGRKVCILTRHFDHSVRNEIRLSSNSHRIQHEQTDVTSFWRTQVRRECRHFFSETGESEHIIEPTICMFVMCEEHLQIV